MNLRSADLRLADLRRFDLSGADLSGADLRRARLLRADLSEVNLGGAYVFEADLCEANLNRANLPGAILMGANLEGASLVGTDIRGADLTGCRVYGISAWDLKLDEHTRQGSLVITPKGEPDVSVDNLKVAQFVYLLLTNPEVREAIDTISKKLVLILGRFSDARKPILEALREALPRRGFVPVLFDFDKPASRGFRETVTSLAHLARFVVADLTDATEVRAELTYLVPNLPSVAFQPILLEEAKEYATFEADIGRYQWVLPIFRYRDQDALLAALDEHVIAPADTAANKLTSQQR